MKCDRCGSEMRPGFTGMWCPRDCDRIPEVIEDNNNATVAFDSDVTAKFHKSDAKCCDDPDLAPFALGTGHTGQHCWTCGKVFQ